MTFQCKVCNETKRFPVKVVAGTRKTNYHFHKPTTGKIFKTTKGTEITSEVMMCQTCAGVPETKLPPTPEYHDCNSCDRRTCDGDFTFTGKRFNPINVWVNSCWRGHIPPKSKFSLLELALNHPSSLNKSLSALPFKTDIKQYLN